MQQAQWLSQIGHKVLYLKAWSCLLSPQNLLDLAFDIKKKNTKQKALARRPDGNEKFPCLHTTLSRTVLRNLRNNVNINKYYKIPSLDGIEMFYAKNHKINFPFHTHNTYNISLILKNSFNLELTNKSYTASKGSIVITNPSELHATPCDIGIGTTFFTFYIPPSLISFINHNKFTFFKNKIIDDPKIFEQLYASNTNSS